MTTRHGNTVAAAPTAVANPTPPPGFWIGVVSRNHVAIGVAGSFAQVNHGKAGPLERMREGDGFIYYSPRTEHPDGPPLQAFTAIGRVRDGVVSQFDAGGGFRPYRRAVDYFAAQEAPIKPLLPDLSFIRSKTHWGAAFRFGIVRVPADDFARIAAAMGRDFARDFPGVAPAGPTAGTAARGNEPAPPPRPRL
jgi:hypothetical protein